MGRGGRGRWERGGYDSLTTNRPPSCDRNGGHTGDRKRPVKKLMIAVKRAKDWLWSHSHEIRQGSAIQPAGTFTPRRAESARHTTARHGRIRSRNGGWS